MFGTQTGDRSLNPTGKRDYIIKTALVKELMSNHEVSEEFLTELNRKVINMILSAMNRCSRNHRRRVLDYDL